MPLLLLGLLGALVLAALPVELDFEPLGVDAADAGPEPVRPVPADALEGGDTTVPVEDWEQLADCESGRWAADGEPEPDSARWDYGLASDHGDHFQGGLNFHPETWEALRDPDMPGHAGRASKREEIEVAERVLEEQGWQAWPVCSEVTDLAE